MNSLFVYNYACPVVTELVEMYYWGELEKVGTKKVSNVITRPIGAFAYSSKAHEQTFEKMYLTPFFAQPAKPSQKRRFLFHNTSWK